MPVPKPNLVPPFHIVRASHVEFTVKDLAASRAFYADTLGLQVTGQSQDCVCLRGLEERGHHSIMLRQGPQAVAGPLAFKVYDECDLDQLKSFFEAKSLAAHWIERPHQGRTLRAADPSGTPLEFYARMDSLPPSIRSIRSIAARGPCASIISTASPPMSMAPPPFTTRWASA